MTKEEAIKDIRTVFVKDFADKIIKALEQEQCGDAVSRQAVLEQTYNWSKDEFLRITNPFDYLRKRINDLPSVTPQEPKYCDRNICVSNEYNGISCKECEVTKSREPSSSENPNKWIPVSERLPDNTDDILVYDSVDIFVAWYSGIDGIWCSEDNRFDYGDTPIIAWQPLPEPYEPQESEE